MKKVLFSLILTVFAVSLFAQIEVGLGLGRMLTSEQGSVFSHSAKYELNYNLTMRYHFNSNFSASAKLTRDGVKIQQYLFKHNYIDKVSNAYQYTILAMCAEYNLNNFYIKAGLPIFFYRDLSKVGYEAGVGWKYYLNKHFAIQTEMTYCYVKDFLVPVANVIFTDISLVYRW